MASFKDAIRQGMEAKAERQREADNLERQAARAKAGNLRGRTELKALPVEPHAPTSRKPEQAAPTTTIVDQAHRAHEVLATNDEQ